MTPQFKIKKNKNSKKIRFNKMKLISKGRSVAIILVDMAINQLKQTD